MSKNYNFERKKLLLPEYGRHIHKMVEFLMGIEDRELRNRQALVVIDVMGNINPLLRDTDGFKHKLWDHLFIISNFKLDVDSPFPIPTSESLNSRPQRPDYPKNNIRFKHYGRNVVNMIKAVSAVSADDPDRQQAVNSIARYMKSKSQEFNNENANNEIIMNDINAMSGNQFAIDSGVLNGIRNEKVASHGTNRFKKGVKTQNNGKARQTTSGVRKYSNNNAARKNGLR